MTDRGLQHSRAGSGWRLARVARGPAGWGRRRAEDGAQDARIMIDARADAREGRSR